jgi:predicted chitinase
MLLTAEILQAAGGCTRGNALCWAQPLSEACALYEIDTPARLAAFLAQVGHESGGFIRTVENLNYSAEGLLKTWPSRFTPASAAAVAHHPGASPPSSMAAGWATRIRATATASAAVACCRSPAGRTTRR